MEQILSGIIEELKDKSSLIEIEKELFILVSAW